MESVYLYQSWPLKLTLHHTSSFPYHLQTLVAGMASHGSPCSPETHSKRAPVYIKEWALWFLIRISHTFTLKPASEAIWAPVSVSISRSQEQENHVFEQRCEQQPLQCSNRSTTTPPTMFSYFPSISKLLLAIFTLKKSVYNSLLQCYDASHNKKKHKHYVKICVIYTCTHTRAYFSYY